MKRAVLRELRLVHHGGASRAEREAMIVMMAMITGKLVMTVTTKAVMAMTHAARLRWRCVEVTAAEWFLLP